MEHTKTLAFMKKIDQINWNSNEPRQLATNIYVSESVTYDDVNVSKNTIRQRWIN